MDVVEFPLSARTGSDWDADELRALVAVCEWAVAKGRASSWECGVTEAGDPQLYLTGPGPDFECVLCCSRLGRLYLLEDGEGGVLGEYRNPALLAEAAQANLAGAKYRLAVRVAVAWAAAREAIEEKLEPLTEPVAHVMPQLGAFA
ncbi:MAG: hypothetical protein QOD74_257 [Variibacter sp.]|jgi:hypothetical protein|nr:hypothetical protein [Variibacter sp.]